MHVSASRHYSLSLFVRSSVFAGDVIHVPCCYSFLIHSLFIGRILCRTYTIFMYHIHLLLTRYTHSSLHLSHSALVNVLDWVSIHVQAIRPLDLSFSNVTFICRAHLCSFISHRAWSVFDLFLSLTFILFQEFLPDYSATISIGGKADVHIAQGRPPRLLLSLVLNGLNVYPCWFIFDSYKPGACYLNQTSPPGFIALHYSSLLHKELFSTVLHI